MNSTLRSGLQKLPLAIFYSCVAAAGLYGVLTFLIVIVIFPNRGPVVLPALSPLGCPTGGNLIIDTKWGRRMYDHFTLGYACTAGEDTQPADELRLFLALTLVCFGVIALWWLRAASQSGQTTPDG